MNPKKLKKNEWWAWKKSKVVPYVRESTDYPDKTLIISQKKFGFKLVKVRIVEVEQ